MNQKEKHNDPAKVLLTQICFQKSPLNLISSPKFLIMDAVGFKDFRKITEYEFGTLKLKIRQPFFLVA